MKNFRKSQDASVVSRARRVANQRGLRSLRQWLLEPLALRGEWVEIKFCAQAAAHGVTPMKPWGHAHSYDVTTEAATQHGVAFARIQIKGTASFNGKAFVVSTRPRQGSPPYAKNAFEFFAYYIVPMDCWYIIPKAIVDGTVNRGASAGSREQSERRSRRGAPLRSFEKKPQARVALRPHIPNSRYIEYLENWPQLTTSPYLIRKSR